LDINFKKVIREAIDLFAEVQTLKSLCKNYLIEDRKLEELKHENYKKQLDKFEEKRNAIKEKEAEKVRHEIDVKRKTLDTITDFERNQMTDLQTNIIQKTTANNSRVIKRAKDNTEEEEELHLTDDDENESDYENKKSSFKERLNLKRKRTLKKDNKDEDNVKYEEKFDTQVDELFLSIFD